MALDCDNKAHTQKNSQLRQNYGEAEVENALRLRTVRHLICAGDFFGLPTNIYYTARKLSQKFPKFATKYALSYSNAI